MKLLDRNMSKGFVKLELSSPDDSWLLFRLICAGDVVKGRVSRKVQVGSDTVKKSFVVRLRVERCDFLGDSFRILGIVMDELDDVPKGAHQSLSLSVGDVFSLEKDKWSSFEVSLLDNSLNEKGHSILVVVLDRDSALLALTTRNGYKVLASLRGEVAKKRAGVVGKDFFPDVAKKLEESFSSHHADAILVASPSFWKDEFVKVLSSDMRKKVHFASCSSDGERGIVEVLKRDEVKSVLRDVRIGDELSLVDSFLREVHSSGRASYGLSSVETVARSGAVATLLISSKLLDGVRSEGSVVLDDLFRVVERSRGRIVLISSDHEGGKILDGLGGIGAILRYSVE